MRLFRKLKAIPEPMPPKPTGQEVIHRRGINRGTVYVDDVIAAICDYLGADIIADYDKGTVYLKARR